MTEEYVEVKITAEQRVRYHQYVRMPKSLYEEYEAMCDAGAAEHEFDSKFEHLIDTTDVCDSDDIKDVTIELDKLASTTP